MGEGTTTNANSNCFDPDIGSNSSSCYISKVSIYDVISTSFKDNPYLFEDGYAYPE